MKIMNKNYLVQMLFDGESSAKLMTERELIDFVNMDDCYPEIEYEVYDVSVFGKINQLHYVGWQKGCLIELADDEGNVVVSGYGEDH